MVPARDIFEALGFSVHWLSDSGSASIIRGSLRAGIMPGRDVMPMAFGRIEGIGFTVPPVILNSRILIQHYAVRVREDVRADWNKELSILSIYTGRLGLE
jgi:hypothetical protein